MALINTIYRLTIKSSTWQMFTLDYLFKFIYSRTVVKNFKCDLFFILIDSSETDVVTVIRTLYIVHSCGVWFYHAYWVIIGMLNMLK